MLKTMQLGRWELYGVAGSHALTFGVCVNAFIVNMHLPPPLRDSATYLRKHVTTAHCFKKALPASFSERQYEDNVVLAPGNRKQ